MKLILLGAPGSGKGTIAEKLAKEFQLQHISVGELLRQEAQSGSEMGRIIKQTLGTGKLIPDHLVIEIVRLVVKGKNNFILDGFPRTVHQAKDIQDWPIAKVIYLKITEERAVERISGRRICVKGTHTYHIKFIPSKKKGFCDIDGSKLIQRDDDREEIVRERFKVYAKKTKPVIDYYRELGLLTTINAANSPEKVYQDTRKELVEPSYQANG